MCAYVRDCDSAHDIASILVGTCDVYTYDELMPIVLQLEKVVRSVTFAVDDALTL